MAEQEQGHVAMRQAVDIAMKEIQDLYPSETLQDLLLEEVLLGGFEADVWEVTLGFTRPYSTVTSGSLGNVLPQSRPRAYKRFKVDARTGEVRGMLDGRIDAD